MALCFKKEGNGLRKHMGGCHVSQGQFFGITKVQQ